MIEIKSPNSKFGLQSISDQIMERCCKLDTPVVAQQKGITHTGGCDKTSLIEGDPRASLVISARAINSDGEVLISGLPMITWFLT